MRGHVVFNIVWTILGIAAGVLLTVFLSLPWLSPLKNEVTNAVTSLAAAAATVGGAYLLWQHQQQQRTRQVKAAVIRIFDGLLEDLNISRLSADYDGAKSFIACKQPEDEEPDAQSIHNYIVNVAPKQFEQTIAGAEMALQQLYSIQDVITGLSSDEVDALLELHGTATRIKIELPEYVAHWSDRTNGLYLPADKQDLLDHGVSYLAFQLNRLDGGTRNQSFYEANHSVFEAVRLVAKSKWPNVRPL